MKKYKTIVNLVLVIVIFIIMLHYLTWSKEESDCNHYNDFKSLTFDGIVIGKYYDKSQHSYPTIELKSLHENSIQKIYLVGEKSNLFNLLSKSDTIFKKKNSALVLIKRNGLFSNLSKANFGCKHEIP